MRTLCANARVYFTGSYRWAWSWFEASILRPHPPSDYELDPGYEVDMAGRKRWLVQRNLRAVAQRQQREVSWAPHAPQTTPAKPKREVGECEEMIYTPGFPDENVERGHGFGDGFVEQLRTGDRVVVHARAWVCLMGMVA
jgi:hypothetical protein